MNARIAARLLGASAALALALPLAAAPASAQDWDQGYGRGPDAGYLAEHAYPGDRDYGVPPEYGAERDFRGSQNQDYPPRDYGRSRDRTSSRYGIEEGEGYGPGERRYESGSSYSYSYEDVYPEEANGPRSREIYRRPEAPPVAQGYAGSSEGPELHGRGYPESEWGYPRSGWTAPPASAGRYVPAPAGRLVASVDLNLRVGPSDDAPVQAVLPAGTPVRVTAAGGGGWVQVDTPFGQGWVYGRYLARA